jgi:hypothetical protein
MVAIPRDRSFDSSRRFSPKGTNSFPIGARAIRLTRSELASR